MKHKESTITDKEKQKSTVLDKQNYNTVQDDNTQR